jgi:hypothetical protein
MGWILLIVFQSSTASIVVDSQRDCEIVRQSNQAHWKATGQQVKAICVKTFEV